MIPDKIILHHSLTEDSGTVSWGAIRRYHIETMSFNDIGYHWGVELVGDHYEILMGRRPDLIGAHSIGQNAQSVGICVVGNYDLDPLNDEIKSSLQTLLTWIILNYKIPKTQIYGHCEFASYKSCPGKNLMSWIKTIR